MSDNLPATTNEPTPGELLGALQDSMAQPLSLLRATALTLSDLVDLNKDDVEGLARVNELIDIIRRELAMVQDTLKGYMNDAAPGYKFTIEGVGTYQKANAGEKKQWDDEAVWQKLAQFAAAEGADIDSFEAIKKLVTEFTSTNWRSTPFKERGIDPVKEELVEKIGGRKSIRKLASGVK